MKKNKAFFFDRDGVLVNAIIKKNKPFSARNIKEFQISKNSLNIVEFLKKKKFLIFVITNQPDVGRNKVDKKIIEQMNNILKKN